MSGCNGSKRAESGKVKAENRGVDNIGSNWSQVARSPIAPCALRKDDVVKADEIKTKEDDPKPTFRTSNPGQTHSDRGCSLCKMTLSHSLTYQLNN